MLPSINMNHALLSLNPFFKQIIVKIKGQFRNNYVHITHRNILIEPYTVWLLNLLCSLIFVKL